MFLVGEIMNNKLEPLCKPCAECDGSGWQSVSYLDKSLVDYLPCEFCGGDQCFTKDKNGINEIYEGKCNEHCGHNRESIRENWKNSS